MKPAKKISETRPEPITITNTVVKKIADYWPDTGQISYEKGTTPEDVIKILVSTVIEQRNRISQMANAQGTPTKN